MPRKKTGRPRKDIDLAEVEKLATLQCTDEEFAAWFDCSVSTIEDRRRNDAEFSRVYKSGWEGGKRSIRRKQREVALAGNVTMLIWLGKQILGQKDKHEVASDEGSPMKVLIEHVRRDLESSTNGSA